MSVDWDLLADHLGGALTGTREDAQVRRLIATDPDWAHAAGQLSRAVEAVSADLRAAPVLTMPDEITARLDAVLHDLPTQAVRAGEPPADGGVAAATVPAPRHAGRPAGERRHPPTRPGPRKRSRRLARWGAGVAAAAGVVAFAAVGFGGWQLPTQSAAESDDTASAVPDTLDAEPPRGIADEPTLAATGTDYRPDPLALIPPDPEGGPSVQAEGGDPASGQSGPEVATDGGPQVTVPPALDRLWSDPPARAECLELVSDSVEPGPATIEAVDFAHFQAEPALVIWVTAADGGRWVRVVGPACGSPAAGPDLRFETRLP